MTVCLWPCYDIGEAACAQERIDSDKHSAQRHGEHFLPIDGSDFSALCGAERTKRNFHGPFIIRPDRSNGT